MVDCGIAINPDNVKAQLEGAILFGLNAALNEELKVDNGYVSQSNFHDYDAMRMFQCPNIEGALLENAEHMGGAGEPGTPAVIPALGNAIFAATGKRVRSMPFTKELEFAV